MNTKPAVEVPVLIVGGGPAGLSASLFLGKYGVNTMLIDKHPSTANSPRAHITNQRTVEILRDAGIEDNVLAEATPNHLMSNNVWATSFAAPELARLRTWGTDPDRKVDYEKASPSAMCNIPQHLLEPILAEAATQAGGKVYFGHEFLSLEQNESGVSATVLERATGETYEVRSRYLIGADGGRSHVAEQIGLPLMGQTGLGASVNCWFEADLSQYVAHRPGVLYWMVTPGNDYWVGSGTFICVRPWNEWVMLFMYDPAQGEPDLSEKALLGRIRRLIGDADVSVNIKSVGRWQINHVVAQRYSAGRVFCVGDAVHRHPPANGLGSNTSIQDSYNLAWKLALVLEGKASASLLQTYNAERQPVGQQVVDRAMKSVVNMLPISNALGFRPDQSEGEGWRSLERLQEDSEQGELQREALREAVKLQNYQFNAHGVELGQRYCSHAVILDGTPEPPYTRDPELYYHPTTWPGARLPHAWLERSGERLSTLDIAGKGHFVLFTGMGGDAWVEAAQEVQKRYGVCVEAYLVGGNLQDIYGDWAALREVEEDGCVLVRPDLHVAWRSLQMADFPTERLLGMIGAVLGT